MKQTILLLSLAIALTAFGCKKKVPAPNKGEVAPDAAMQGPAKCNSLNDFAVKSSQATFVPAAQGGDSGEEHLDIKDFGLEQGFEVASNCLSELAGVDFEKFKKAGFTHEIQDDGLFVTISLKKTSSGVRITYAAGI